MTAVRTQSARIRQLTSYLLRNEHKTGPLFRALVLIILPRGVRRAKGRKIIDCRMAFEMFASLWVVVYVAVYVAGFEEVPTCFVACNNGNRMAKGACPGMYRRMYTRHQTP